MAHKTLIGGTAYEVKGGKTKVNGTAYGIAKGRTLVGGTGHEIPFSPYAPNFADNDWATIIAACQNNEVPDTWKVGDNKTMTINGTSYQIDIIGKNHDTYADGSGTAPLTFQMHDSYTSNYAMNSSNSNTGGWAYSSMRDTHLPAIFALMPSEVQAAIKAVKKLTSAGAKSSTINTTADMLFLLSEIEIFGSTSYSKNGEGSQYAYYSAGNSKVKKRNGTAGAWWERSPRGDIATHFCYVLHTGVAGNYNATTKYGVSFAFCFGKGAKMISFTYSGVLYYAEEGMTWAEWVNSGYNTDGATINGTDVCFYENYAVYYNSPYKKVVATDTITDGVGVSDT